jgi:Ca2+-binding RTX toxin-like protein
VAIGSGPDVIEIGIAQDAWMGNAKYVVLVNGVQVGGTLEAGALRGSGQSDIVRVGVDLLDGVMNTVAVRFLNDAFGGTAATDRNLYVTSVAVNGTDLARTANLMSNGEARFSFMRPPPSTPPDTTPPAVEITAIEGGDDIINAEEAAGGIAISGSVEAGAQVVVNGVAATVTGTSWTATLPAPASDGAFGVSVTATDAAGNAATVTRSLTVDRVAPSAIITISDAALTAGETAIVSIVFSEAVTGFCVDDLDLSDAAGELGPLTTADGIRWEAVFTPISDVIDVTNVIRLLAGGHADAAGNPGLGAQSANFMIDTRVPFYSASAGSVNEGDTLSFTVTRSVAIAAETLEFALGGTALAGVDYVAPASFRIAFAEGQSVATVSVATLRDTVAETNETVTFSLRGAGGAELLSVTGTIRDATIVGTRNADVLTGTSGVDLIMGQNGNDSVNGLDGNDSISGGEGADTLAGGLGADTLSGGPGNDIFIYSDVAESPVGPAVADLIVDFVPGADRIHLAGIDANTLLAGHQAFGWGGQSTAVMRNGVTWFQDAASGTTIVRLEVNGDPVADAEIRLSGLLTLSASDFVL